MSEHILTAIRDGVLRIEIHRRAKKNALTQAMYRALVDTLRQAGNDDTVRVVLLSGEKDLFSAGNDLKDFLARKADDPSEAVRFISVLAAFEKPLVAAVGGDAVGIGTTMLLHCDLVYAADNARFQLPFVPLGLCPEAASSLLLPRLAGYHRAAELMFFAEPFGAEKAREIGFVNQVFAPEALLAAAAERAGKLATLPPESLAITKSLLKRATAAEVTDTLSEESRHFSKLVAGPISKEICAAFLEKRPPDFSGIAGYRP